MPRGANMNRNLHRKTRISSNFTSRRAFTLVEMLLATSLLALLMVGLLAVITDFSNSAQVLQLNALSKAGADEGNPHPDDKTLEALVRLLEDDFQHAQAIAAKRENQLLITGYSSLNLEKGPRSHRPVQIVYSLENVGDKNFLIRRQTLLDVLSNQNVRRDLVLCGIQRFTMSQEPITSPRGSSSNAATSQSAAKVAEGRWLLRLWSADQGAPIFERCLKSPTGAVP
jgi:prepilin-type N-terminal cleavage/methylation domain-containing protein